MGIYSWDDKYLTGHHEIDRQHRQLFEILNKLHAAMKSRQGDEAIDAALAELVGYTQGHFATEEGIMLAINYPDLEEHRAKHWELIAKLAGMTRTRQAGERVATFEVLNFLGEWISDHVGRSDVRIGKYLRNTP